MSLFLYSRLGRLTVVFAVMATGLVLDAYGQGTQRTTRRFPGLSETNSAEIITNLNQLATKKDGVNQLEEQLRTLKEKSTSNPMERRFSLPYVPSSSTQVLPNKTLKELLERRKNWGLTPEELGTAIQAPSEYDSLSSAAEDKFDSKQSSLQQFYDALNRPKANGKPGAGSNNKPTDESWTDSNNRQTFRDNSNPADDPNLPAGIREKAQKLKDLETQNPNSIFNATRARSSFDDFFGLNEKTTTAGVVREPKTSMENFMDQFKKAMEGPSPGVKIDPSLNSLLPEVAARRAAGYPAVDSFSGKTHHELNDLAPHNSTVVAEHSIVPDMNSAVLNQWNPLYAPPKLELPKPAPVPPPNFEFPKRRF